jgi:hypothetical protein
MTPSTMLTPITQTLDAHVTPPKYGYKKPTLKHTQPHNPFWLHFGYILVTFWLQRYQNLDVGLSQKIFVLAIMWKGKTTESASGQRIMHVEIWDWKRTPKALWQTRESGATAALPPCQNLRNNSVNKYIMSLSMYKLILETFYKNVTYDARTYDRIQVDRLRLVRLDSAIECIDVDYAKKETEELFAARKQALKPIDTEKTDMPSIRAVSRNIFD